MDTWNNATYGVLGKHVALVRNEFRSNQRNQKKWRKYERLLLTVTTNRVEYDGWEGWVDIGGLEEMVLDQAVLSALCVKPWWKALYWFRRMKLGYFFMGVVSLSNTDTPLTQKCHDIKLVLRSLKYRILIGYSRSCISIPYRYDVSMLSYFWNISMILVMLLPLCFLRNCVAYLPSFGCL